MSFNSIQVANPSKIGQEISWKKIFSEKHLSKENVKTGFPAEFQLLLAEL